MLNKLGYWILYGTCWLVGLLPHWFLFNVVTRVIYFLLYRIARYRLKVVRENLSSSFPEKSEAELRRIERGFYRNLAEYFLDAVDLASISPRALMRRTYWPEENRHRTNHFMSNRNWVALLGHYGSWEVQNAYGLHPDSSAMVSVYKPLGSKVFDLYYHKIRNRFAPRINSIPNNELIRYYVAHRDGIDGKPFSIALIADQHAPLDAQSEWIRFLNHPTVFFHGGEKIARKFSLPVFYLRVRKLGRGCWEQTFDMIWDGVSPTHEHEITRAYAAKLEEDIRRAPELWLWSHKRWKRRIEGEAAREYNEKYGTDY